jgi:hypothetical protein
MTGATRERVGAASGAVFAVVLFAADSAGGYGKIVAGIAALSLFIPFLATLTHTLRMGDEGGWLSTTAFAAGLAAITIKLISAVPEIAERDLAPDSPTYKALVSFGDAAFSVTLFPLAIFFAATAAVVLASRVLPRWLGIGAAVTAAALAVNACFIDASFGPAFLLFIAWTFAASIVLLRRSSRSTGASTSTDLSATTA